MRWALRNQCLEDPGALIKWMNYHSSSEEAIALRGFRHLDDQQKLELDRAISNGQIESKLWLTSVLSAVLPKDAYNICVVGAWIGILGRLMAWQNQDILRRLVLVDQDEASASTMRKLMPDLIHSRRAEVVRADANLYNFNYDFHIIVNLATEHFASGDWYKRIPRSRLVVLQGTNDRSERDHVACVDSVTELRERYPLRTVLFHGVEVTPKGKRYMLIGRK